MFLRHHSLSSVVVIYLSSLSLPLRTNTDMLRRYSLSFFPTREKKLRLDPVTIRSVFVFFIYKSIYLVLQSKSHFSVVSVP